MARHIQSYTASSAKRRSTPDAMPIRRLLCSSVPFTLTWPPRDAPGWVKVRRCHRSGARRRLSDGRCGRGVRSGAWPCMRLIVLQMMSTKTSVTEWIARHCTRRRRWVGRWEILRMRCPPVPGHACMHRRACPAQALAAKQCGRCAQTHSCACRSAGDQDVDSGDDGGDDGGATPERTMVAGRWPAAASALT